MTAEIFGLLAAAGLIGAAIAALGVEMLRDFPRHQLEEFCQRRGRLDRFSSILDHFEEVTVRLEAARVAGICVSLVCLSGVPQWQQLMAADNVRWCVLAMLAAAVVLLALCVWLPCTLTRLWNVPLLYVGWPMWLALGRAMWPLTVGVSAFDALARRMAGKPDEEEIDEEEAFEDEIRTIVSAGEHEGLLEADAREMIEGVIELGDTEVSDIMTPRSRVDAVDVHRPWPEVLAFVTRVRRTRIPVYDGTLDNIIGILYAKDLLAELAKPPGVPRRSLRQLLRKPLFVPATKRVDDMLKEFLETRSHLAIVVDEYQRVAGVVTIEDVLEEIVGEIVDEADRETEHVIRRLDEKRAEALGTARLDELNEALGLDLPTDTDYDTIGGLLMARLGRVPKPGDSVVCDNVRIHVLEADRRRVERVRLERLDGARARSASEST